jgi:glycine cleavage system H protein
LRIGAYEIPDGLLYMKEHTWLSIEGHDLGRVGITDYLQKALREISFIYLPKNGLEVRRLKAIATVESIKAISEIYSPASGRIVDVNLKLVLTPGLINQDPYVRGWVAVIQSSFLGEEASELLEAKQYAEYVKRLIRMDKPRSHGPHADSQ